MCMNLNRLAQSGAALEVTFYDAEFDDEDEESDAESRDDFVMLFVGPDPAAIMQVQRDLLVQDVINMMERHFDGAELGGVVAEIDKLFGQWFVSGQFASTRTSPARSGGGHGGGGPGGGLTRHLISTRLPICVDYSNKSGFLFIAQRAIIFIVFNARICP